MRPFTSGRARFRRPTFKRAARQRHLDNRHHAGAAEQGTTVDLVTSGERSATSRDDALVERARRGDEAAFEALVASRLDRCYRLAWAILLNDADAADATQEALVAAWRQLPRLRDASAFDGWLNRIVANAARMARRHRVRLREVQVRPVAAAGDERTRAARPASDIGTQHDLERVALSDAIGRAFDRLRDDERLLLAMHHVDERPVAEMARTLGIPVGTVKWRLHSARSALERALEAER
jgi:RNA polymerase sigma-70 factor (ECF subfamily)